MMPPSFISFTIRQERLETSDEKREDKVPEGSGTLIYLLLQNQRE